MAKFHISHYCVLMLTWATSTLATTEDGGKLLSCLHGSGVTNFTAISSPPSPFYSLLYFSAQNLRFTEPLVAKPYAIIIPQSRSQLRKSVMCSISSGWQIRVRSGGHSYEGLSYTSDVPFVLIDLMKLNNIHVDTKSKTAWVEAGATLGQVYYTIGEKSNHLAFTAGVCPTVGAGGHIAGGGLSFLSRKYGLAADNVIDAELINASATIMNRKSMGEDVFWAICGGGGSSWGVVVAWKIRLVSVPHPLTVCTVLKTGTHQVTETVHRWQYVGPEMEEDLFVRVKLFGITAENNSRDIRAAFEVQYLGPKDQLLIKMNNIFPELSMAATDCKQVTWRESTAYFGGTDVRGLRSRHSFNKTYFKIKSDFAKSPLPESALRGLWPILKEELTADALFSPLGGVMDRIPPSATPFPQRAGTLFDIQYEVTWNDSRQDAYYIEWMRKLYKYMEPYVSHSPRATYVDYVDLDFGSARNGTASVEEARAWGESYFNGNYERLVKAKTQVDRYNFFRNAQSMPPLNQYNIYA